MGGRTHGISMACACSAVACIAAPVPPVSTAHPTHLGAKHTSTATRPPGGTLPLAGATVNAGLGRSVATLYSNATGACMH